MCAAGVGTGDVGKLTGMTDDTHVPEDQDGPGLVARLRQRWQDLQDGNPWLAHALRANQRVNDVRGSYFAAGITFFSFVSLFPLILVVVAVLGFVLRGAPGVETDLLRKVQDSAPQGTQEILSNLIGAARTNAGALGIAGIVSGLLTGLGWISNLREGTRAMWKLPRFEAPFVASKLADLSAFGGLLLGGAVSIGATGALAGVTGALLRAVGLDGVPGAGTVTVIIGILIAVLANLVIMVWFLSRLPRVEVPRPVLVRGAFLAAIGFEILTLIGTWYIKRITGSAAGGVFGTVLGVLVYVNLVARFLLYASAWTATGTEGVAPPVPEVVTADPGPDPAPQPVSPARVAGVLVGAGAAIGGATVGLTVRRMNRRDASGGGGSSGPADTR